MILKRKNSSSKNYDGSRNENPRRTFTAAFVDLPVNVVVSMLGAILLVLIPGATVSNAMVDIDSTGGGDAVAFDGENSISTRGDTFCEVANDIADGRFSSIFEGLADCDTLPSSPKQFLVEYSFDKDQVKIGDATYLTIAVKDKNGGQPVADAFVRLTIEPPNYSTVGKAAQGMYTDKDGHAIFTLQIGPNSNTGIYNSQLEIRKDSYQLDTESMIFHVV